MRIEALILEKVTLVKRTHELFERHINAWSTSLQWFFDPSKWAVSQSNTTTPTLNSVDEAKKQNYIEEAKR